MRRDEARCLAHRAIEMREPLSWFEELYSSAASSGLSVIPWADLRPNPNLIHWLDRERLEGAGKRALVIGCGLGDDAEELARRGFAVTAFDISHSAISIASGRFESSEVRYVVADLFQPPTDWTGEYDLVCEAYTLQVLPPELRSEAVGRIAAFVSVDGILLLIARARDEDDEPGDMPWPLTRSEFATLGHLGLEELSFEDYLDSEKRPVRRFRAAYRRSPMGRAASARQVK